MTRPCLGINIIGPAQSPGDAVNWRLFRELKSWVGPDNCPPGDAHSDAVLISGRVRVAFNVPAAPFATFPVPGDPASLLLPTKAPFVKLGVSDCDQAGEIIIDSDQTIVLFGPQATVRVLVPPLQGGDDEWREAIGAEEGVWSVNLKVRICPAPCCNDWPPVLTESHVLEPGAALDLTIPRHARTLAITGEAVPTILQWWNGDPGVGVLVGTSTTPAAADAFLRSHSATHVRVVPAMGVTRSYGLRWEIAP
jgi:hypothetical protein